MGTCLSRSTTSDTDTASRRNPNQRPSAIPDPSATPHTDPTPRSQSSRADKGKGRASAPRKSRSGTGASVEAYEMNSNSAGVLRAYATLPSPSSSLAPNVLLTSTPSAIAVFDAYPKAKYHFLVMPRYPFPPQNNPDSTKSIVRLEHLDDLRSLLTKTSREAREQIVGQLAETAREVEEMIRDEMVKSEGMEWKIDVGFHAIPSLKHVHLHVISEDRISPSLKTKKHYNSFRPDLGFFVSIADVQRWIMDDDAEIRAKVEALLGTHSLLTSPLTCFKCDEPYHTIPKLKLHLEKEFETEKKKALETIRRTGTQRSSDEEMF